MRKSYYIAYLWSYRLLCRQMPFSSPCTSVALAAGSPSSQLKDMGMISEDRRGHLVTPLQANRRGVELDILREERGGRRAKILMRRGEE